MIRHDTPGYPCFPPRIPRLPAPRHATRTCTHENTRLNAIGFVRRNSLPNTGPPIGPTSRPPTRTAPPRHSAGTPPTSPYARESYSKNTNSMIVNDKLVSSVRFCLSPRIAPTRTNLHNCAHQPMKAPPRARNSQPTPSARLAGRSPHASRIRLY